MDPLKDGLSKLKGVKGLGEARMEALLSNLGPKGIEKALAEGDISALVGAGNIPERLAVDMVLAYRSDVTRRLYTSEAAWDMFLEIRENMALLMHTDHARNQLALMVPTCSPERNSQLSHVRFGCASLLDGRDRMAVDALLTRLGSRTRPRPPPRRPEHVLLAETEAVRRSLVERGLDRTVRVMVPEELDDSMPASIVLVYEDRELDEERLPLLAALPVTAQDHELVPETVLGTMLPLRDRLDALAGLETIFGMKGRATEAVVMLDELSSMAAAEMDEGSVMEALGAIGEELKLSMKERIAALNFSGEDAIALLLREEPLALKEIYREHSRLASALVRERLGVRRDLFKITYPPTIDQEAVRSMLDDARAKAASSRFDSMVRTASSLVNSGPSLGSEFEWANRLDFDWGIGSFVKDHDLHPFSIADGVLEVKGAARLDLRRSGDYQGVSYHLGGADGRRAALMTGANSGGKTTLLEMLAQTVLLASVGMPVPAAEAKVPPIERLVIFKPKRRLDAGGLEGFLRELLPFALDVDGTTLVLADELEAMTELDAAARIIGVFMDELMSRGAYSVVVTHLSDEICRYTSCRVDGIEAKGLDENNELIVDRTPIIGRKANSTPELILRKLCSSSDGAERELYSRVLSRFG